VSTMSQSEKIRRMANKGKTNGEIAKALGIRYQTVWRTLHRPFKGIVPQEHLEAVGIRTKVDPLLDEEQDDELQDDEPQEPEPVLVDDGAGI